MGRNSLKVDKFTGRNSFGLWQLKVKALLKSLGVWAPLKDPLPNPLPANWETLEEKAHSTLLLALEDEIITEVAEQTTAVGLWNKLEKLYMKKSLTNKLLLKQRLFGLRMKEGTSLKDHLDSLNTILLDLRNIEIKVDDEDAALILLVSLPPSYENFRESLTNGKDTICLEDVRTALHSRELRLSCSGAGSSSTSVEPNGAFHASSNKPVEKFSNRPGRGSRKNNRCNYCKEEGHWKVDCPKLRQGQQSGTSGGTIAFARDDTNSEEDMVLVATDDTSYTDVWVLDSGASYHMCPRREWFSTYEQLDSVVSTADGSVCKVVGIGSVRIRTHDGRFCTLSEVRHVPHLTKNLISLSRLDKKGFSFRGEGGGLVVYRGSNVILRGVKRGTLFVLEGRTFSGSDSCGVGKQVEQSDSGVSSESGMCTSRSLSGAITSETAEASVEHHRVAQECPERAAVGVPSGRYDCEGNSSFVFLVTKESDLHESSGSGSGLARAADFLSRRYWQAVKENN